MSRSIEQHLDNLFNSHADDLQKQLKGEIKDYTLYDADMMKVIQTGKCTVNSVQYDSYDDCNHYSITDIDTGERITAHQFRLKLRKE